MKNNDNVHSVRYYIFRHDPTNPEVDTVRYRESTGNWSANFSRAMLWSDYDFTVKKAKELRKCMDSQPQIFKQFKVVIGKVKLEVDGLFPMVVVE
mgnify:CR=1 FL=1